MKPQYIITDPDKGAAQQRLAMRPKAVLFDMDGTLYDSMGNHADAWLRMVTELGIKATREEFFLYEGRTGRSTLNIIFNRAYGHGIEPEEADRLYAIKTQYFRELPEPKPFKSMQLMVAALLGAGITPVLVTGSGQMSLIERLARDFPGAFPAERCVTARNVTHGKPSPEPFLKGLEMAGVSADEAIAVDNAPLGVRSASDAGIFTVGLVTGPIPDEELRANGADVIFKSPQTFADIIMKGLQVC